MKRLVLLGLIVLGAPAAHAQIRPEAEKLFRDGKQLMKDGKIAEACSAFEASEKAEHSIATLLSLADCREKNFQFASAWALFLQADSQTRADPRLSQLNATAKNRATQLEPRLSYLTINVSDESRIPDLIVTRDGVPIDPAGWNRALPTDGGAHEIAGKAPGHESWSTRITLKPERDKQQVEVPKFKELPKLAHPEVQQVSQVVTPPPPEPSMFTTRRKIGIGVAAGGVVIAGISTGLAITARSLRSDALATCPANACSPQNAAEAQSINDRARSRALMANIGFGVGGAAVIAGAVLWFVGAPVAAKHDDEDVAIVPQTNGFAVVGRF